MKKSNFSKIGVIVLSGVLMSNSIFLTDVVTATSIPIKNLEEVQPIDADYWNGYLWEYVGKQYTGDSRGSKIYVTEHKAVRDGEYLTVTKSVSASVSFSGAATIAGDRAAAELGISIGASVGLATGVTSGALKAGETVKAYAVPIFKNYTATEREISYTLKHGTYTKYEPTGKKRTGILKNPKAVDIQFQYSRSKMTRDGEAEEITRIETYTMDENGIYQLTNTISFE